jgi:predicted ATP-grasp superfamily ATP-dependent carboligase
VTRVLVTDGEQRAALAAVRSLGRAGHQVSVCASTDRCLAGASRFAKDRHVAPNPLDDPAGFVDSVARLCRELEIDVLLPITDAALEGILPARNHFHPTRIPFPDFAVYTRISDKARLMAKARELGIPTPEEVCLESPVDDLENMTIPSFPLVIKPSRSVILTEQGKRKVSVRHVQDEDELRAGLRHYPDGAYPLLLQQYIPGAGEGGFFLIRDGEAVARFAHRRLREKPPSGGVSVYRESIALAHDVESHSLRLLRAFEWSGVAMVEFRRSRLDGRAYLMEVNGRFWGSLQLAVDSGVDFPRLLLEAAMEDPVEPVSQYRTGIRSRWWLGDLDHLLIRLKGGEKPQQVSQELGSRAAGVARFLIPWRPGDRSEVMRISDPGPGLREMADWGRALLKRRPTAGAS